MHMRAFPCTSIMFILLVNQVIAPGTISLATKCPECNISTLHTTGKPIIRGCWKEGCDGQLAASKYHCTTCNYDVWLSLHKCSVHGSVPGLLKEPGPSQAGSTQQGTTLNS
ncbi:hypothetical protein PGT21_020086 [Puccinia graminis f. sp. tritici]|uniref:Uncharacterized protein n=1 Tax=Puccinia graminis f. sp. tritici TaxID=56615 RepID=A0A5B0QWM3_PUCGR|nr:hypothetical protein PGT21_020086 [Puccinia graminis f. sp. tritici]KAA1138078.1 hypothetical protein PGTUg99_028959 [Puccinia graminis f. sp. tritici]